MPNAKYRILSTRPLPQDSLREAAAHGIDIYAQAFIDVQSAMTPDTRQFVRNMGKDNGVMVFTSPNAVKFLFREWLLHQTGQVISGTVYCLQGATRQAIEEHFEAVTIAGTAANSQELAELIVKEGQTKKVLFFSGNIRRNDLPHFLQANGVEVEEHVVYNTVETPAALTETYDGVMFFSPSSVRSFFAANTLPASAVCFAIGHTTGTAIEGSSSNRVIVSPEPAVPLLVETAIHYFDNINNQ